MERDGILTSLWQYGMPQYESVHTKIPGTFYDTVIVGGGITGITTALEMQKAGHRCLLLEAETLCFGTTGGTTAHINTLLDTPYTRIQKNFGKKNAHLVAEITRTAIRYIKQNLYNHGIQCGFEEQNGYLFSRDDQQSRELDEIASASSEAGLELNYTDSMPIPIPFDKAIRVERQARFHPVEYLLPLAKAFENAGGVIVEHCRVTGAEQNQRVHVRTQSGEIECGNLIYATHIPPGVNLLHMRCAPYRSYAMAVRLQSGQYPDGLVYDMEMPFHYYRTQEVNGNKYFIAGGEDHKTGHEENTEAPFLRLESHLRKYFDIEAVAFKWSSQYFEPDDGLPYIGHLPGQPGNIFVATGFSGNGMTFGTVSALLLRDLILNGKNDYTTLFDPNRIKPVAGFGKFVKENLDVAKELLEKILPAEKLQELAGLAYGEGRVIKFEHHHMAIYKDEQGMLHALDPVCPHLKCDVTWNIAEKTWDCPCHGSRFNIDGEILTGPATKGLERIELAPLINEKEKT